MISMTLDSVHSARYDWRGPMSACPQYRLQQTCETIFVLWSMPVYDLIGEGRDPREAYAVDYLPPMGDGTPAATITACEWIVPGVFAWN